MEILQSVRVRGERWRVADVRAYDGCQLLTLVQGGRTQRVLTPFDDVETVTRNERPSLVTAKRWRRACREQIANDTPPGRLRTAARADMELLPHQLEPALALLRGVGSRVLLADDVGLGKTIQAGLIVSELLARGCVDRVLILTPAGVRDQWSAELRSRFDIAAAHADAASLRRLGATLPLGVNPWQTMPVAIASIDYFKRLEVLPAAASVRWDVVVLDEAHASAGDSERRDAVRLVAGRAAYVILLTATPHSGDDEAFEDLCGIGAVPVDGDIERDRLVVFRRTRQAIRGEQSRRVHVLRVRPGRAERHMHDALARYRRAVAREHGERALALSVLEKRAYSSPWSLATSVDRRLATLDAPVDLQGQQLALPIDDVEGELTGDDSPPPWPSGLALSNLGEERRLLMAIAASARSAASHDDSKLRALGRLLRRVREAVLVFTEYRDSAVHIRSVVGPRALLLHGGMDRQERASAIEAFTGEPGAILIATDAAGQGLNLHHRCRLVVNVELPWNPMRLEQRIGRVDRIGQPHRVHAVHLVALGTGEADILSRLQHRVARAKVTIDAPDPIGTLSTGQGERLRPRNITTASEGTVTGEEVHRLHRVRAFVRSLRAGDGSGDLDDGPLLMRARRSRLRTSLAGRTLMIYRLVCEDGDGRPVESSLVPLLVRGLPVSADPSLIPKMTIDAWRHEVEAILGPFSRTREGRERAIAACLTSRPSDLFQAALFDRRSEIARDAASRARVDLVREAESRVATFARRAPAREPVARLLLVAQP